MRKLVIVLLILSLAFIVFANAYKVEDVSFATCYNAVFDVFESAASITNTLSGWIKDFISKILDAFTNLINIFDRIYDYILDTLDIVYDVYDWVCEKIGLTPNHSHGGGSGWRGGR